MAYLLKNQVREFHIEPTSRCNLLCPQCARTDKGRLNSELPMHDLPHRVYEKIFTAQFSKQLHHVYFCGNYGDPAVAADLLTEIQFLREQGVPRISLFSNGGCRSPEWWRDLAGLLNREEDKAVFSIDGLEDTNHLYRINCQWSSVMANTKAFIGAGGKARWDWLVFEHNAHQLEQGRALSQKMGFLEFNEKATARFITDKNYKSSTSDYQIKTRYGEIKAGANKNLSKFEQIIKKYGSWKSYVETTKINCKYQAIRSLYLDFEGDLWPCCWTGAPKYFKSPNGQREQLGQLWQVYGQGFNNLETHCFEPPLVSW